MKQKKIPLICFAGCDWWYHNRGLFCMQIMKHLSKHYKILFINSLSMRIPSLKRDRHAIKKIIRKFRSIIHFIRKTEQGMYIFSPISLPLNSRLGRKLNTYSVFLQVKFISFFLGINKPIVFIGCPPALEVIKKIEKKYLVYQRTDNFQEMTDVDKDYIKFLDNQLIESADLVLYVNKKLWEEGIKKNKNSLLLGHGVDYDLFANAVNKRYVPEDLLKIPRPIIGFYGDISEKTSDMKLLEYTIANLPECSFVFIGSISTDISSLNKFRNTYFLGRKSYDEIPFYGKEFNVAIMPWNKNKWIEFCNPVKTKEYLALGKPIVSIYYPEIEPYSDLVYTAVNYNDFTSGIRKALQECEPAKANERRKRVQDETWESKIKQLIAVMNRDLH